MSGSFSVTLPSGATWTPTFVQSIDEGKCIGCGRCFRVCPRGVLEDLPEEVLHPRRSLGLSIVLAPATARCRATRGDEVVDLVALLLDHTDPAAGPAGEAAQVADTVATACLGDNHLWQDLNLGSRAELSALMRHWFPALVQKNHHDMKWKKFLYKQLCEREDVFVCKAPSCAECTDHAVCFGPEV